MSPDHQQVTVKSTKIYIFRNFNKEIIKITSLRDLIHSYINLQRVKITYDKFRQAGAHNSSEQAITHKVKIINDQLRSLNCLK